MSGNPQPQLPAQVAQLAQAAAAAAAAGAQAQAQVQVGQAGKLEELIDSLAGAEDKGAAQRAITDYLRGSKNVGSEDWLNDYQNLGNKKNCPLPIEGDKCVSLLSKCLAGDRECMGEWSLLKFEGGFDVNKMDLATARNLVQKMKITGSVDEFVRASGVQLQPSVLAALKAIVNRVRNASGLGENRPYVSSMSSSIPFRVAFTSMSGGMIGGGGNRAAANFIQMSNYLKNRYTLVGGASNAVPSSVAALRSSLVELERALQAKDKKIDENDKERIIQLIDSLQSTEQKAEKAAKYMSELRRLINHPKFNGNVAEVVTAQMMEELSGKHRELLTASAKKSTNLLSILETIASLVDDVKAIRNQIRPAA